ncbi:MAG: lysoplasmalogenase [Candidatus Lokiarchaeota archaeon]|nr:lysoplasmalogenase [Candidatus Lokiarchaeota archaeon]
MIEYIFLVLFFIFAGIEIFSEYKDIKKIEYLTKPLLMPLLILFYTFGVIETTSINNVDWLIIVALIGGCAGDIFLMLENEEKWFLFGMVAFLINQLFYIISFFLSISDITNFTSWGFFLLGPAILILVFTVPRFIKKTEDMKIPVLVYLGAILLMHIAAIFRLAEFAGLPFVLVYVGSISFIFSDACIAVNKWAGEFTNARLIIMTTYILAQFYITLGLLLTANL